MIISFPHTGGTVVGPQIELSATVLSTGEILQFVCRESTDYEGLRFVKIIDSNNVSSVGK